MDVNSEQVKDSGGLMDSEILKALKKRALLLNDEESFKLVLQLEHSVKPLVSPQLPPNGVRKNQILARCEAKLVQKKNFSLDAGSVFVEPSGFAGKAEGFCKELSLGFGSRCRSIEKSMNLLNERCEQFQKKSDLKDCLIRDLTQKNVRLKEKNRILKAELKDGQENCTKMVKLFERKLRNKENLLMDRTKEVENQGFVGRDAGFRLNECGGSKGFSSENASPTNFLSMGRSRRLLSFGDERRY